MAKPDALQPLSTLDFARFRALILASAGFELPDLRRDDLKRVLDLATVEAGVPDRDALYRLLSDPTRGTAPLRRVISGLTVGESYFFRDQAQISAIRDHILPELIMRRAGLRSLRIWSAGCSTGEEPYTLAIILDQMAARLVGWDVEILATDINPDALEAARRGIYSPWSFRQTPGEIRDSCFNQVGRNFEIHSRLKGRVRFAELNLGSSGGWPLWTHDVDLILCRNVLIYLSKATTERLASRFLNSLNEGGWLIVGASESSQSVFHEYVTENFPGAVAYRKPHPGERPTGQPIDLSSWTTIVSNAPDLAARPVEAPPPSKASRPNPTPAPRSALGMMTESEVRATLMAGPTAEGRAGLERAWAESSGPEIALWAAMCEIDRMDWPSARAWADRGLARAPTSARGHYLRGVILRETGDLRGAAEDLRRCLYLDPGYVLGHVALAGILANSGQMKRARVARASALRLLDGRPRDQPMDDADGLTVGRLLDLLTAGGPR